jgi:hypothetical protein
MSHDVPVLTDIVARHARLPSTEQDTLLAELTTKLAARATLREQISNRRQHEVP